MIKNADVVIVGGGISGCSTAYRLAEAGVKNIVVIFALLQLHRVRRHRLGKGHRRRRGFRCGRGRLSRRQSALRRGLRDALRLLTRDAPAQQTCGNKKKDEAKYSVIFHKSTYKTL